MNTDKKEKTELDTLPTRMLLFLLLSVFIREIRGSLHAANLLPNNFYFFAQVSPPAARDR
jgi:hypothetical protein